MKKNNVFLIVLAVALVGLIAGAAAAYPKLSAQVAQMETDGVPEPTAQTTQAADEVPSVTLAPVQQSGETEATAEPKETKPAEVAGPVFKRMAADFAAYTDAGEAVSLASKRGKPVVVNFFASWCSPCKYEMPYFEEFYLEYGDRVEFMMVNLNAFGNDTKEAAKKMVADGGYTFPVYFDSDGDAAIKYAVRSMPTTLFVSADGELKGQKIGMIDRETLKATVEAMIAEAAQ